MAEQVKGLYLLPLHSSALRSVQIRGQFDPRSALLVTLACKGKDKAQRFLGTAQECSLAERSALGWARRDMHEERKRRTLLPGGPFKREIV